jgi:flagellum-specific peptidoglycan hydrolase FlgJ
MTIDETQVVSIQQPVQSQTTRASNSTQTSGSKQNTSFKDQSDFVQQMTNAYVTELQKRGYDPAFAEYLVAQDALESG